MNCQAMIPFCLSDKQIYKEADVVFIGTVLDKKYVEPSENTWDVCWTQESGSDCGPKIGRVKVHKVIKGSASNEVTLLAEDSCYCTGALLGEGYTYKFFVKDNKHDANFSAMGHCGTKPISEGFNEK